MGLLLIAQGPGLFEWLGVIPWIALGLGFVIFVHELGHFLVAKACGVQCDKFYIGFDVGGLKLFKKQWGETEYGIGIIPLGGYVKMLGQDDNPANAAKELERARMAVETGEEGEAPSGEPTYALNPRSYMAKSVPQRMAIISAGVIMNVIFAFIFAAIAYGMGVKYLPCVVTDVVPGSPAWLANLQPGDEIVQIGNIKKPRFTDLKYRVSLSDVEAGVPMVITRPGVEQPIQLTLKPEQKGALPTIGVRAPASLTLFEGQAALDDTPAAAARPALKGGDRIIAANGQSIESYAQLEAILARAPGAPLQLTVLRPKEKTPPDAALDPAQADEVTVEIGPNPMKRFGMVMNIGAITGVQQDSPAAAAGLQAGDFVLQVNGESVGDPETLPDRLREMALAGETVELTIERASGQGPEKRQISVTPRVPAAIETPLGGAPLSAPALGIAYRVLNRIQQVEPGSPADKAGIVSGDEIVAARLAKGASELSDAELEEWKAKPVLFGNKEPNWPAFLASVQRMPAGMQVEFTVKTGEKEKTVTLAPAASSEWFNPERGLALMPIQRVRTAESFGDALALGARETKESLLMVYRFLQKLGEGQVPLTSLGGPGTIAKAAGYSAMDGPSTLLLFLTMLSANLAVVNFLPIPVLDGGHMVFLTLEAILRRPVNEKVVVAFHTIGFLFIISLMLFVISLDLGLIARPEGL